MQKEKCVYIHPSMVAGKPASLWQPIAEAGLQISCSRAKADRLIHSAHSLIKQAVFPQDSVDKQHTQLCLNPLLAKATNKLTSHSLMALQCLLSFPVKVHWTVMWRFDNLTHHQTNQFFYVQVKIVMPITETEWHDHPLWMISYALRQGGVTEYTFWWWK